MLEKEPIQERNRNAGRTRIDSLISFGHLEKSRFLVDEPCETHVQAQGGSGLWIGCGQFFEVPFLVLILMHLFQAQ